MSEPYHIPALLNEAIEYLNIKPDGIYVDATFGGGGHSREIINKINEHGHLYSFDQDLDALKNSISDPRFTFVHGNFKFITNFLRYYGVDSVDGILADLGVSFHHFDAAERGFTFREDAPLDMRMNRDSGISAVDVLNTYPQQELEHIFKTLGELDNAKRIAALICSERKEKAIETTFQLKALLAPLFDPKKEKKELAKAFQAIRITVNKETEALETLLQESLKVLKPGGRLVIISYHSLEDRLTKNFMKTGNFEGKRETDMFGRDLSPFKLVTSKAIVPSEEEITVNPRSRSAKMRVAQKM